jgi:hypothetical protein
MTGQALTADLDARAWAARQLNCDCSDIRSLLTLVTESDYVLSANETDAAQVFSNCPLDNYPAIVERSRRAGEFDRLTTNLADFKRHFFNLPCLERKQSWELLAIECSSFPDLMARLMRLKNGLDVTWPATSPGSNQQYLLQVCRDVFLASPLEAAHLRRRLCDRWRHDVATWEDVVDEMLENHGGILQAIAPWVDQFGDRRLWESRPQPAVKLVTDQGLQKSDQQFIGTFERDTQYRQEDPRPASALAFLGTLTIAFTSLERISKA